MPRSLAQRKARLTQLTVNNGDPLAWLRQQAQAGDTLLAHLDDGVVWGFAHQNGDWITSNQIAGYVYSPALRAERLWEARLFSEARELLLWRDGDAWRAREIRDVDDGGPCVFEECFDEPHLLWGTGGRAAQVNGVTFALLEEGAQGLRHAPPIDLGLPDEGYRPLGETRRVCLVARHYLAPEDVARVAASRLVKLDVYEEK